MSKFTRDVIKHSNTIRKAFIERQNEELKENDKYIQQIKRATNPDQLLNVELTDLGRKVIEDGKEATP